MRNLRWQPNPLKCDDTYLIIPASNIQSRAAELQDAEQ